MPLTITVGVDSSTYGGDTAVEDRITLRIQELNPGFDVTWACVGEWVKEIQGVFRITALSIDGAGIVDKAITDRQKAQPGTITVTNTPGSP